MGNILSAGTEYQKISIASIDMDNLKLINDIYGHADSRREDVYK
ncbi:MAG: hypothetical protein IKN14_09555 [Clostridiales bacterium]|nr:hypothetical protein [Clostridiales bacterium]